MCAGPENAEAGIISRPAAAWWLRHRPGRRRLTVTVSANYFGGLGGKKFGEFDTNEAFRWVAYIKRENSYPAKNVFGAEVIVHSYSMTWYGLVIRNLRDFPLQKANPWSSVVLKIRTGREEARTLKANLRLLLV